MRLPLQVRVIKNDQISKPDQNFWTHCTTLSTTPYVPTCGTEIFNQNTEKCCEVKSTNSQEIGDSQIFVDESAFLVIPIESTCEYSTCGLFNVLYNHHTHKCCFFEVVKLVENDQSCSCENCAVNKNCGNDLQYNPLIQKCCEAENQEEGTAFTVTVLNHPCVSYEWGYCGNAE